MLSPQERSPGPGAKGLVTAQPQEHRLAGRLVVVATVAAAVRSVAAVGALGFPQAHLVGAQEVVDTEVATMVARTLVLQWGPLLVLQWPVTVKVEARVVARMVKVGVMVVGTPAVAAKVVVTGIHRAEWSRPRIETCDPQAVVAREASGVTKAAVEGASERTRALPVGAGAEGVLEATRAAVVDASERTQAPPAGARAVVATAVVRVGRWEAPMEMDWLAGTAGMAVNWAGWMEADWQEDLVAPLAVRLVAPPVAAVAARVAAMAETTVAAADVSGGTRVPPAGR